MNSKNYTDVLIDGKIYTLGGFEEESYLQRVASYINEKVTQMKKQEGFKRQSPDYQNVMIELNMADDYFKAQLQADILEREKNEMEKDVYSLKHELVTTQLKLEAARQQIEEHDKKMKEMSEQVNHMKIEVAQSKAFHSTKTSGPNHEHKS